jgi:malate dehydrogenase
MKISFIGAGGVACNAAFAIGLTGKFSEIAMLDIRADFARGKAMDLAQGFGLAGLDAEVSGGGDYKALKGSDVIVITAGVANSDGTANREELLAKNRKIIKDIAKNARKAIPARGKQPFVVIVTNPLDIIVKHFIEAGGFDKRRVAGAGNLLDAERFKFYFSRAFKVPESKIDTLAIGQHGVEMVYLLSQTKIGGRTLADFMKARKISMAQVRAVCRRATAGAGEIIGLGTIGTYYGPAMSVFDTVMAYANDRPALMGLSVWCEGEYGIRDCCLGMPAVVDGSGVREIKKLKLSAEELAALGRAHEFVCVLDK